MEPRGPFIRVGWIGLGIMGRPMAENARRVGFQVVAYNRNPARGEVFARRLGEDDGTQALIEVFDRLATKPQ